MSKKLIQPIHNKPKEIDPILKSLNVEKMNSSQVQEEIAKQEKILNNFISHYKYTEAETCDKKITALKKVLKQKKTKEIKQRHTAEKETEEKGAVADCVGTLWFGQVNHRELADAGASRTAALFLYLLHFTSTAWHGTEWCRILLSIHAQCRLP